MRNNSKVINAVKITELLFDEFNYRIGPQDSQEDCQRILLSKYEDKIKGLAKNIAENGLGFDPIVVIEQGGSLVVSEGNRRILALKLLNAPNSAPESLRPFFQNLLDKHRRNIPDKIDVILTNKSSISKYKELRHLGIQSGEGILPWGPDEQENMREAEGGNFRYPIGRIIKSYLLREGFSQVEKMQLTNIQRLFQSPRAKERLGFKVDNMDLIFLGKEEEVKKAFELLVSEFVNNDYTVDHIKTVGQAISFIEDTLEKQGVSLPLHQNQSSPLDNTDQTPATVSSQHSSDSPKPNLNTSDNKVINGSKENYKYVILSRDGIDLPRSATKALKVQSELRKLQTEKYIMAATSLLRILIEESFGYYCQNNKITFDKLPECIRNAADDMYKKKFISKDDKSFLERFANEKGDPTSLRVLNSCMHAGGEIPHARDICIIYDNMKKYLRICWQ